MSTDWITSDSWWKQHPGQVGLTLEMHDAGSAVEMPSRSKKGGIE
jgi:hypothetical protein